jgi:hypothetical protein
MTPLVGVISIIGFTKVQKIFTINKRDTIGDKR